MVGEHEREIGCLNVASIRQMPDVEERPEGPLR